MSLWDYLKICHQYGSPRCYAITSIELRSLVVVHCMKKVDRIKKWELCPATYCFIHNHKIISGLNQLSQTAHFFVNCLPSTHGTTRYFLNSPWIGFNKCYLVYKSMSPQRLLLIIRNQLTYNMTSSIMSKWYHSLHHFQVRTISVF